MKSKSLLQHLIAIGASAGGMEAIHAFFDHTPIDKVSYVVIQHLSPDHQSRLAELLNKHSKLEICLAENGMPIETNRVYVIPNKEYLTIREGKLYLSDKQDHKAPHMTIDTFFISLAAERGTKAIGVILSGNGNDGSAGIKAIHEAGGWVIAQDPDTAKFSKMPTNAIATGVADVVLAPEAMPKAIENYVKKELASPRTVAIPDISDQKNFPEAGENGSQDMITEQEESVLVAILNLIKSQLPFDFSDYKRATIFRRIRRRMAQQGLSHSDAYLAFLQAHPAELEALAKDFLISVTSFFRDRHAFETLERLVIPAIMDKPGSDPLKIWIAGCATGQEAYSLAILVAEYLDKMQQPREVKIFATDLDQHALEIASKGVYPATIAKEVLPSRLKRFFTREGDGYKVKYDIRKMLIFAHHDLVKNPPYCNIDLIACRNLLIYLNPILQKKIFEMLHFGLRQGGYLFLGAGENAHLLAPQFEEVDKKWKIYQKTTASRSVTFDNFSMPETGERMAAIPNRSTTVLTTGGSSMGIPSLGRQLTESVSEALMSHFGQVGVCVDEDRRVIQAFGDLTPYLLPKVFNYNLADLLPEALSVAFGTAFSRAVQSNETVTIGGIRNELGSGGYIHLLVKPFVAGKTGQKLLLVLLSPDTNHTINHREAERFDPGEHTRQHLISLEAELSVTREKLQITLEKLESSTENLQSFNEELLSSNEEMQSVNEELQSVNEELQTVNTEHQLKIRELSELNDDLNNYFRSNVSGQLFVDKDLLLKKFSPAATQHINLRESDIGRPLYHITTNIRFESLVEDISQVINLGESITREVQATNGKWFQVMVMAYIRQSDQKPVGAMVTFYDVTDLVLARRQMEESSAEINLILEAMPQITSTFGPDGRIDYFNQHWYDYAGGTTVKQAGDLGWAPALHPEDSKRVMALWKQCLSSGELFESEFRFKRASDDTYRWHLTRAVPLRDTLGKITKWVSTSTDIQDQRLLLEEILLAKEALMTTNGDLNRTNIDLDNFVYTASHDLKAPINNLKGLLAVLSKKLKNHPDTNTEPILAMVNVSIKKLMGVIGDLSEIAQVQKDLEGEKVPIPFREMLNEVLAELGEQISESKARIHLNIEIQELMYARKNLRSILYNLLSNAIKYRSEDRLPDIHLTFRLLEENPILMVSDNGLGLMPAQVDKLFSLYKRFHDHVTGTGIGLYMVKRIIENNGGRIEVASQEGRGTTFTVYFSQDKEAEAVLLASALAEELILPIRG